MTGAFIHFDLSLGLLDLYPEENKDPSCLRDTSSRNFLYLSGQSSGQQKETTLPDFQIIQRLTVYKPIQSLDCGEFTLGNLASPRVWSNGCWTLEAIAAPFLAH